MHLGLKVRRRRRRPSRRALRLGVVFGSVALVVLLGSIQSLAQPSNFVVIDGFIRAQGPPPSGSNDWGNSGTSDGTNVPGGYNSACTNAITSSSGIHADGTQGLFDCGAPSPTAGNAPVRPNYVGPSGVAQAFIVDPLSDKGHSDLNNPCIGSATATSNLDPSTYTGSTKNGDALNTYTYGPGTLTPKDDLGNVYALSDVSGAGSEIFFGAERVINNGDSHMDFEFIQQKLQAVPSALNSCSGSFNGHRSQGDFLISADFPGNTGLPSRTVNEWHCTLDTAKNGTPLPQTQPVGTVCDPGSPAPSGVSNWSPHYQDITTSTRATAITFATNSSDILCGGWVCRDEMPVANAHHVSAQEFMEGGVNLSELGFTGCINTFLPHTRSSGSFTAELKDFAGPVSFNNCSITTSTSVNGTASSSGAVGDSLGDSATVTGFAGAPGSVTFDLFRFPTGTTITSTSCDATHHLTTIAGTLNPVVLVSPATFVTSSSYVTTQTGLYEWVANYFDPGVSTTTGSPEVVSVCGAEPTTISPRQPAVTTLLNHTSILNSGSVTDTATLSGATSNAGGSITISVYKGSDASACVVANLATSQSVPVNGNGGYPATFSGLAAGNYEAQAVYSGDANNLTASSACGSEPLLVENQPSITTKLDNATILNTGSVTDTATLSGSSGASTATGAITINVYSGSGAGACVAANLVTSKTASPATAGDGSYTATFSNLAAGNYEFQAVFAGDTFDLSATSACGSEPLLVQNQPSVTTSLSASSINIGDSVTDTATLSGATSNATGVITINVYSGSDASACVAGNLVQSKTASPATNGNGAYTATFTGLAVGSYEFQATYAGDTFNKPATSACGTESLTVKNPQVSQITPTNTTCSIFSSGTSATLSTIQYSTKSGVISQVDPGVFFYWVKLTSVGSGSQTFTITQSNTGSPTANTSNIFLIGAGSNAFDSNCNTLKTTVTQDPKTGAVTVTFNAGSGGTIFIGIKYSTGNVVGETVPTVGEVWTYVFATTGVAGSTSNITLSPKF